MRSQNICQVEHRKQGVARFSMFGIIVIGLALACDTGDVEGSADQEGSAGAEQAETSETGMEAGTETGSGDASAGESESGSETGMADAESEGTAESTATGDTPLANGMPCDASEDCESLKCKQTDFGGVCSDCETSEECRAAGTGDLCGFDGGQGFFTCTTATLGDTCESTEDCPDETICTELIPGVKTCGRCATDSDCAEDVPHCSPVVTEGGNFQFHRDCVATASLANGAFCDDKGSGEDACVQHCEPVTVPGLNFQIGVCGECRPGVAEDCEEGQTCKGAVVDFGSVTGSVCE